MDVLRTSLRFACAAALAALAVFLTWLNACAAALRQEPRRFASLAPATDEHLELARRYAPWIYHEVDPEGGRQDLPAPVDFDGDLGGENNWEHFAAFELPPTVYYACLESGTHFFFTYHLFHPRDWARFDLGLHMTHENDGENLQVVVDKRSREPVLLFTQAHYRGVVYANAGSGFESGEEDLRRGFLRVDELGVPDARGTHAGVLVQSQGHGILGALDRCTRVSVGERGEATFELAGLVLRPARDGEEVREPALDAREPVAYSLESTTAKLWPLLRSGELVGEGRLLDRAYAYEDERVKIGVPRFYEANRFSGPFGPDRGISPFAVDFGFEAGELGALFFDPARRYAERLRVPEGWSREYERYPFANR